MQTYASKKKSSVPAAQGKATENISKSDMLRMSGAGAPQPMSPALREKFEPGFGADFSNIRISRGHIPEEMGVQAVAKGTDILIDSGAGMDVLGHELAHVVQQAQGQVQGGFPVVHDAALEHQADVMGARVASGMSAMEGGMSGFGGGEMMSIAPMSDASAPAQCKSRKEKKHEKAAGKAGGFRSTRVNTEPHALGSDALLKEQLGSGGMAAPAAAMQAAKDKGGNQSDIFQASGVRTKSGASGAISQRRGNAYAGLSADMTDWGMGLSKQGLDWAKVNAEAQQSGLDGFLGGMSVYTSPDISKLSTGAMDIYSQYLGRKEIQQHLRDRHSLIKGTNVFDEGQGNGTELDFTMTDLMNREFGLGAFGELKQGLGFDDRSRGVAAVNGFVTRLPNIVRDLENGTLDEKVIPDHMWPAIEKYKAMRGQVAQIVDPQKYDAATGARVSAPARSGWKKADVSDAAYNQAPRQLAGAHRDSMNRLKKRGWY